MVLDYFVDFKKNRFEVLNLISESKGINPGKVWKTLGLSVSTTNNAINNFYLAGLISKDKKNSDNRLTLYVITYKGRELLDKLEKVKRLLKD